MKYFSILIVLLSLNACAGLALGGAVVGAKTLAEDRSVGNVIDDTTINAKINSHFFQQDGDLFTDVDVDVHEGRVLLAGTVKHPVQKKEAERLAWLVKGVREVNNEIQITDKSSIGDYLSDVAITSEIKTRILFEKGLSAVNSLNYGVDTINSIVYLMGIAKDSRELVKVTDIARQVSGVKKVVSHVLISDDPRRKSSPPARI